MRLFFGLFLLAVFFGCVSTQLQENGAPDANSFGNGLSDKNFFDQGAGLPSVVLVDLNTVHLDLDQNRISFNFEIDLNSPSLDLNVLAGACDSSCGAIDANSWKVSKDLNFGIYYCTCTRTTCFDRKETKTQILLYCRDDRLALRFVEDFNK